MPLLMRVPPEVSAAGWGQKKCTRGRRGAWSGASTYGTRRGAFTTANGVELMFAEVANDEWNWTNAELHPNAGETSKKTAEGPCREK